MEDEVNRRKDKLSAGDVTLRQLRIIQSLADFQMALSAVNFMSELDKDEKITRVERRRYRCYEDTAVIAYCRPFTKTNGLPLLSFKQLGVKPTDEQMVLHRRIIERRNKIIAHSDADKMRIALVASRVFDDHHVLLPHFDFDDGLEFFDDRWRWIDWLRILCHAAGEIIFHQVQGADPYRFVKDYLHPEQSTE